MIASLCESLVVVALYCGQLKDVHFLRIVGFPIPFLVTLGFLDIFTTHRPHNMLTRSLTTTPLAALKVGAVLAFGVQSIAQYLYVQNYY
jgi:hypothetical protein